MSGRIDDAAILKQMLTDAKTIAVVGHSDKPTRTSYMIAAYLRRVGYTVYAVNPTVDMIDGEPSYASLNDVPAQIDIVNVFRRSEHLPGVVEDAPHPGSIRRQDGVLPLRVHLGSLDAAALPLRSGHAPGLADHAAPRPGQPGDHGALAVGRALIPPRRRKDGPR